MKLLGKVNLLLTLIFGCSWGITEIYAYRFLMQNARDEVIRQADLMMQGATSTRNYTAERIKPLLESELERSTHFHPETVPAFAANRVFEYLRQGAYSDYTYRETSLNPTNPTDRAVDWEADIISTFRNHSDADRIVGERDTPTGRSLFVARPMRAEEGCIACHGVPAKAPKAMVRIYGAANGFGWKQGEIVAARVVSVPMAVPIAEARQAFLRISAATALVFVCTLGALDWALYIFVLRPVRRLSAFADRASTGEMGMSELPVKGRDEISRLTAALNRMYISLRKAMRLLDG
jgi:HAMP domain-containing protein